MKKNFYGEVSLAVRISFSTEANSKEEVKEKIFNAECLDIKLLGEGEKEIDVEIQEIEWNLINQARRGNIQESYISDMEIYEDE